MTIALAAQPDLIDSVAPDQARPLPLVGWPPSEQRAERLALAAVEAP